MLQDRADNCGAAVGGTSGREKSYWCLRLVARALKTCDSEAPQSGNSATDKVRAGWRAGLLPGSMLPYSRDRKSTRLNSSHVAISYAVFCLKKKKHRMK